ncbi:MAG TPA: haloacid dehalogenase-like hydrolase [Phycisphaerales bacterium]|nr:haloacid dehalogenase-like hydrolase [Phycisphaerales bacterium]
MFAWVNRTRLRSRVLILFDIDATLVLTSRSGLWAMELAGQELFGDNFLIRDVEFAGRLDTLIIPEIFERSAVPVTPENLARYKARYAELLEQRLADPGVVKTVLPGVRELLAEIGSRRAAGVDVTVGLLTGNYEHTGRMKLRHCGLDLSPFVVNAFADDAFHPHGSRDDLPPVALRRYRERHGREADPSRTVIIGDSPADVRCAKVNGCRALAVATGVHSLEQLRACTPHAPDLAVQSLADTAAVAAWMFDAVANEKPPATAPGARNGV